MTVEATKSQINKEKITPLVKGAYHLRRNKNKGRTDGTALI